MAENTYSTSNNRTLIAVSSSDGLSPVNLWADPVTHGLVVSATISSVGLATAANQTNGSQITQIQGSGGGIATVTGGKLDVNATASLSGSSIPIAGAATAVGVAIVDGSGNQITSFGGGSQYTDGAATIAHPIGTIPVYDNAGTIASVSTTNRLPVTATLSGAVPAGTNVIGHVISDTGSTTAVTQATAGNLNATVVGTGTFAAQVTGTVTTSPPSNASTNIAQINAVTPLMGNGTTGTGSQRVTIASDNTAFSVNATLSAETTKVIGVVRNSDGAGNLWTSNSTTYTAKFAQDSNLLGTLGTAFSTAGKVDVKAADGDVFVRQATASNLNATVVGTGTFAAQSSLTGLGTVSTANSTTVNLAGNATFTGTSEDVSTYAAIQISILSSHASATDGLSLQQSSDATNWDFTDTYTIPATTGKVYSIQPSAKFFRLVYTNGVTLTTSLRIQTVFHQIAPNPSSQRAADAYTNETDLTQNWTFNSLYNGTTWDRMRGDITNGLDVDVTRLPALVAGTALIGKVGLDQTTPGTTNAVSVAQLGANAIATGNGASSTGVQRVAQVNDGTGVLATVSTVTSLTQMNGAAIAMGTGTRSAGTQRVTIATDDVVPASQSGTWTVQPGNTPNTTPWLTTQTPKTSGGLTTYHLVSAATTNATNIKASAGQVFGWFIYNSNAAARKLVFHNTAGTPTAGASVFFSIVIPPSAGANVEFTNGIAFSTGIGITTVTGLADTDSAAVALNDLIINVFYT